MDKKGLLIFVNTDVDQAGFDQAGFNELIAVWKVLEAVREKL